MKLLNLFVLLAGIYTTQSFGQSAKLPEVEVKDMSERPFNTGDIDNGGKPIVINFWATWCSPCKRELNNIADIYDEWVEETGVKIIAVTIDDARNVSKVAPYVNAKAWDYDILLDVNQDFKRSMGVNNIPHTFLLDKDKNIVWQHNSYSEGDEYRLYELIKKLANGETIN